MVSLRENAADMDIGVLTLRDIRRLKRPMKCIQDQKIKNTKGATLIPESVLDVPDF